MRTNVMTVGLIISEKLRERFPLTPTMIETDSQVQGLSGSAVAAILARENEFRPFTSEGGRTSRGSLGHARALADRYNICLSDLGYEELSAREQFQICHSLTQYFVQCIQKDYYGKQRIKAEIDPSKPVSETVLALLEAASLRDDNAAGALAQHLVGAKLELRFPEEEIGLDSFSTADQQTSRNGDFTIGSTAFHVTVRPTPGLVTNRCSENLRHGIRPLVIVPSKQLTFAQGLVAMERRGSMVGVVSLEQFVGINIEEIATFSDHAIRANLRSLLYKYNERIEKAEKDQSLQVEIPQFIVDMK